MCGYSVEGCAGPGKLAVMGQLAVLYSGPNSEVRLYAKI